MQDIVWHSVWYFPDEQGVFLVENTLYNVHKSLWRHISATLDGMFICPPGEGNLCEGMTDKSPIRLPLPMTVERFDHLLEWFYTQYSLKSASDFDINALDSILVLASYLQIDTATAFALNELHRRPLTPTLRLLLGQKHRIPLWIPIAFRELLLTPEVLLGQDEFKLLGLENLHILHDTQARIRSHRLAVAFTSPAVKHEVMFCGHVFACEDAWAAAWWGGFARHYLHPDSPSSAEDALSKLKNAFMPGVTPECQSRTVQHISKVAVFQEEELMITNAISKLQEL